MKRLIAVILAAAAMSGAEAEAQRLASRTVTTSGGAVSAVPVVDTAITRLEGFLERYPASPLRPRALFQLGELLVVDADEQFAQAQRAADSAAASQIKPNYARAIQRYEELVTRFPTFEQIDAARYTLGALYSTEQRYADAARVLAQVASDEDSRFRPEALFRLGDAYFELAAKERGAPRLALFAQAATAYEQATRTAPAQGDIYFLALYKLGWSYYNQATQQRQDEYRRAVEVFGTLVEAYDKLTPEQQSRLGLRGEAIEYMAVAFTQVGGAEAANRYFASRGGAPYRTALMRRVAESLRDQGDFTGSVRAYETFLADAGTDSLALTAQREIVDIYQNRMIEPDSAQAARLRLVERFGPGSAWARANPAQADSAQAARDVALRQSAQYLLAAAQAGQRDKYAPAAELYRRYLAEFPTADSAQAYNRFYAEALFGTGDYMRAGAEFARAAYAYRTADTTTAQEAGRNAIVSFDSALARNKSDRAAQDSLFAVVDRFVAAFPQSDVARRALVEKGRRASETERWDVMASTFRAYAERYPNDAYTPTAQRLVGDALYKAGQYTQAQAQWETAQRVAVSSGNRALADSIGALRTTAAAAFADTLIKQGQHSRAAEEVYVAYARANPNDAKAADAMRNAIEAYMLADSTARLRGDARSSEAARGRAIELSAELVRRYPRYQYRLQYEALRARLLADMGRREEAISAYQALVSNTPQWSGRADAMIRVAVMLDSLGRKQDAAAAYVQFATAYPGDARAADAMYNAAITYEEAKNPTAAADAFARFADRFPRDERVAAARTRRIALLRESGDTRGADAALASACRNPTEDLRVECARRTAENGLVAGIALFRQYQPVKLVIAQRSQLNQAGVRRASAQKQALLRQVTAQLAEVIRTGVPEHLAAATYYVGLAQWEYGNFLRDVELPSSLTAEERAAAQNGARQQAEEFYNAARQTWQELIDKGATTPELREDRKAADWLRRTQAALDGRVDASPSRD